MAGNAFTNQLIGELVGNAKKTLSMMEAAGAPTDEFSAALQDALEGELVTEYSPSSLAHYIVHEAFAED